LISLEHQITNHQEVLYNEPAVPQLAAYNLKGTVPGCI
jgi:hypothetical protein